MNALDAPAVISGQLRSGSMAATPAPCANARQINSADFGELLARQIEQLETRVDHANNMVRTFAVDDSIPLHEVTIALEEARIAVELAIQVRSRIVEAYREVINMQL